MLCLFTVLHSGFAAESTVQHINLMARESRYWGTKEPNHFFFLSSLLWLSNAVSLLTSRIYKMRSLLTHWGLPLLTRKKSNQPIHHHCELTSSIGGCSFWFLPQTWIQVSFELTIVVYFPCWACSFVAQLSCVMGGCILSDLCYSLMFNFVPPYFLI